MIFEVAKMIFEISEIIFEVAFYDQLFRARYRASRFYDPRFIN